MQRAFAILQATKLSEGGSEAQAALEDDLKKHKEAVSALEDPSRSLVLGFIGLVPGVCLSPTCMEILREKTTKKALLSYIFTVFLVAGEAALAADLMTA